MDINMERDGGVIGTLFQQIINDMKVSEKKESNEIQCGICIKRTRIKFPSL